MLGTLDPPANHIRAYRTAMTRVKPTVYRTTLAPSATLSRTGRPASHVCACAVCDALLILSQTHALRTVMTATRQTVHHRPAVRNATRDTMSAFLYETALCLMFVDGCIKHRNSQNIANCVSSTTCALCNQGYCGLTCQPHTCIANCNDRDQTNCESNTTCSECNAGFYGATCQPCM
jgi:hypothetical protein